jgi:uncharacterized protein (DUF2267 family)
VAVKATGGMKVAKAAVAMVAAAMVAVREGVETAAAAAAAAVLPRTTCASSR